MKATNDHRIAYIYALVDDFGDIRYIGSTGIAPQERAAIHHRHRNSDDHRGNPELNAWLRSMEHPPQAITLTEVAWADRIKAEANCTRMARQTYGRLMFNKMDGATPTDELAARKKAQRLGHYKPHTEEGRLRISAGNKRAWERRRMFLDEQRRLEAVMGGKLFRLPRTAAQLREQLAEVQVQQAA